MQCECTKHDLTWCVFTLVGKLLCKKGRFLHLSTGFYTRRPSSYACWQVRTLPLKVLHKEGEFLCLLASLYTTSGFTRILCTQEDEALSSFQLALSSRHTAMGSKPLFQECLVPWALPTNITMCCNVSIPCSNVYGMSGNTTLTSLLP
jgi:hypothetical protein